MSSADKIATLAAKWLAEAADTTHTEVRSKSTAEADLFEALRDCGQLSDEQVRCSYIEPGCVEHGVVHVHVWSSSDDPTPHWLSVDPNTGHIDRL